MNGCMDGCDGWMDVMDGWMWRVYIYFIELCAEHFELSLRDEM